MKKLFEKPTEKQLTSFILMEKEVLSFWEKNKIFEKSVKRESSNGNYVFYDGPPFATGEPHYGHILCSVCKDVVPRYWTMRGYCVERRWGWDCHGLPIENIVEADLKIKNKKQIEEMGVAKFNENCRSQVLKYADAWEDMVRRIGRWVDFKNSYKTMDLTYMESVWWAFKEAWNKGLIYNDRKVLLYCSRCETPVSNFEVAMDNSYKDIIDESLYIKFRALNTQQKLGLNDNIFILAWTTTPWTLPANMSLAVGKKINYVIVKSDSTYIIAKNRLGETFKEKGVKIIKELKGEELINLEYEPLFNIIFPEKEKGKRAYYLTAADFVTTKDGSGIVHIAPVYGEDDYKLAQEINLPIVSILDEKGCFTQTVPELLGLYFEKANEFIVNKLSELKVVFANVKTSHSYPYCHRCDTKLFYKAISSWFLNINKIREKMLEHNQKISWYPEHLKNGRFAKGIEQAPDWNISRNRYFATPIPIWYCKECGEIEVIGSVEELKHKSGVLEINDIHNHNIDHLSWKCAKCNCKMERIKEVFDCWVESASMPFAQMHYPFKNEQKFKNNFPADFISEYISQTRAWFYVMHVISTALFDSHSFKNVVTTGIILTERGEKMSKSKKNFPDPFKIINEFGADALRAYLMGSSIMYANNLFFKESDIKEIFRKNIVILWNVYKFYEMYAIKNGFKITDKILDIKKSDNILDKWILSRLNNLIEKITIHMNAYDLPYSVRSFGDFINDLSTWYIRRSRNRFKSENETDKQNALITTGYVLVELTKVLAPFMPFIAEQIWQRTTGYQFKNKDRSVHLEQWPIHKLVDEDILDQMKLVRKIVESGLKKRAEASIKTRQPLSYYSTDLVEKMPPEYIEIIKDELNVMELRFGIVDELGVEMTKELLREGVKRELVRFINGIRKNAGLTIQDKIIVYWDISKTDFTESLIKDVFINLGEELAKSVLADEIKQERPQVVDIKKEIKINNEIAWIGIKNNKQ